MSTSENGKNKPTKEIRRIVEVSEERDEGLQEFANKNDVILLAFIGSYVPRKYTPTSSALATMSIIDEFGIEEVITDLCKKAQCAKNRKVYLLVNSMGGSLSSAYKTAKALRDAFKDITVFVPHYALSGGTLMALAGNRIRMGVMSQLSPLDVQVNYEDTTVSVNSLLRSCAKLDNVFATQSEDDVPYTYKHMVDGLDPIIIEEWTGVQEEGKFYLKEILKKSGYSKEDIEKITASLVFSFPTHSFVLQYDQVKDMGIKVEPDTKDLVAWKKMREWLLKYMAEATDRHFIRYVIPQGKEKKVKIKTKPSTNKKLK